MLIWITWSNLSFQGLKSPWKPVCQAECWLLWSIVDQCSYTCWYLASLHNFVSLILQHICTDFGCDATGTIPPKNNTIGAVYSPFTRFLATCTKLQSVYSSFINSSYPSTLTIGFPILGWNPYTNIGHDLKFIYDTQHEEKIEVGHTIWKGHMSERVHKISNKN